MIAVYGHYSRYLPCHNNKKEVYFMSSYKRLFSLAFAVSIILGGVAMANAKQAESPLQSTMAASVISLDKNGKEVAKPAQEVEPGQTVEYTLTYKNISDQSLKGIAVTGPIPAATAYVADTAAAGVAADFKVSIDGGKTFESEPVKRVVTDEQGKQVTKIIPPSEYTQVRWVLKNPLEAGEAQTFTYRSLVK
jgi:uncharacterized repeat protein (TIGR01451 family)